MPKPIVVLLCLLGALLALPAGALAQVKQRVTAQLLAVNDFHGHLEPTTPGTIAAAPGATPVPAGGVAYLAATIRGLRAEHPRNTLTRSGGGPPRPPPPPPPPVPPPAAGRGGEPGGGAPRAGAA